MERSKVIILIPSRNEYSTLRKILKKIHREYLILVIDDNSKDNTHKYLLKNKIPFLRNSKQLGYESSLIKGFKHVLKNRKKINYIITMDADGEHSFKDIKKFLNINKNYDLVIGKRNRYNRITEHFLSWVFYKKFRIYDPLSGFKMYKTKKLYKIKYSSKYFLVDLALQFVQSEKAKYINLPINVRKRYGKSRLKNWFFTNLKILKIILFVFSIRNGRSS